MKGPRHKGVNLRPVHLEKLPGPPALVQQLPAPIGEQDGMTPVEAEQPSGSDG